MRQILNKHPIMKGMLAYSITWPTGNIIQQTMAGKRWGNNICSFLFAFKTHTCMKQLCSLTKCLYNFFSRFSLLIFVINRSHIIRNYVSLRRHIRLAKVFTIFIVRFIVCCSNAVRLGEIDVTHVACRKCTHGINENTSRTSVLWANGDRIIFLYH